MPSPRSSFKPTVPLTQQQRSLPWGWGWGGTPHLCFLNEFGDDHGVLLGDSGCTAQEPLKVPIGVGHVHGSAAEHIRGAHHAGVPHSLAELASGLWEQGASWSHSPTHPQTTPALPPPPPPPRQAPAYLEVTELPPLRLADADGI